MHLNNLQNLSKKIQNSKLYLTKFHREQTSNVSQAKKYDKVKDAALIELEEEKNINIEELSLKMRKIILYSL